MSVILRRVNIQMTDKAYRLALLECKRLKGEEGITIPFWKVVNDCVVLALESRYAADDTQRIERAPERRPKRAATRRGRAATAKV